MATWLTWKYTIGIIMRVICILRLVGERGNSRDETARCGPAVEWARGTILAQEEERDVKDCSNQDDLSKDTRTQ